MDSPKDTRPPAAGSSPASAFVVRFTAGADPRRGHVAGRVEHVLSGRETRFVSSDELLAFFGRMLAGPTEE